MEVIFKNEPEEQVYTVYLLKEDETETEVGGIVKYRGAYLFNDYLYKDWWNDIDLKGMMNEVEKYYLSG